MTAPPRGIEREQGWVVGTANWWQLWDEEPTPELQWPHSIAVYDRMRRQDPQVQSVLRAVTYPVQNTAWQLDPAGASDEVTRFVADNLGLPIKGADSDAPRTDRERNRFSWSQHLEWALLQVVFGHMIFEQVATITVENGRQVARLRKLAPRWPRTIKKFNVARDGGLDSIEQWPAPGDRDAPPPIDATRLVVYSWEREGGAWTGKSLLRAAYKPWLLKDQNLLSWTQGIDRNSMGVPVYTDAEGNEYLDEGKKIATGFRSGASSGAGLPYGSKLELLGVNGTLIDPEKAVRYMDEQISHSVLAHFLNLGQAAGTGSYALGSTFADFFVGSLNKLARSVRDVGTQHVIEDLVDWNFGETEPAPKLIFTPIGQNELAIVQAVKALIEAGAIFPDPKLDAFVRDVVGLPPRAPLDRFTNPSGSSE